MSDLKDTDHLSIGEFILNITLRTVLAFLCGFVVCCLVWFVSGKIMELSGIITDPGWWMLYGAIVYKIASAAADKVFDVIHKD